MRKHAAPRARRRDWGLVRIKELQRRFGNCGRSTIYDLRDAGLLPPLIHICPNISGLPDYEVDDIAQARLAGSDDDAIRALVKALEAERLTLTPDGEEAA
jgi:predicted DNA-binding transcriptional regulator AlpA